LKHESLENVTVRVEILSRLRLEVRKPEYAGDKVTIPGPCSFTGTVKYIDGREWLMVSHLPSYGIPLYAAQLGKLPDTTRKASSATSGDLYELWGDEKIEVRRVLANSREEDYFDV
jgi:hypothetical protein